MSHPTFWPKKVFFYPIGNTPPVCLTDHLPPEEDAKILLLGCGDPRNILYTIAVDHELRKMDITCCDLEPAIIARNILLFTFIIDSVDASNLLVYWNIFYDLFLDRPSASILAQQCDKLLEYAADLDSWHSSCYGSTITFITQDSLAHVRRHWKLYKETLDLPKNEQEELKKTFHSAMKESSVRGADYTSISAAVPVMSRFPTSMKTYTEYWNNGITGSKDKLRPLINPTFLFSLVGRKFNLHYGTDLCSSFHLALALIKTSSSKMSNSIPVKTEHEMWAACRAQFSNWCLAAYQRFQSEECGLIMRFVTADALCLCQGLRSYQNGILESKVYSAPWGGSNLHFYDQSTPKHFNVIDTSNLSDHLGLLNILVATQPLMEYSPCSVLHTNTLLSYNDHPTERSAVEERALLDFPSIALFLNITPICFLSGFNFRNNGEVAAFSMMNTSGRNHERLSWRVSDFACATPIDGSQSSHQLVIDPEQLADKLLALYLKMFDDEVPFKVPNLLTITQIPHYNRESFVRFVSTVKMNKRLQTDWTEVGEGVVNRVTSSKRLMVGSNNFQNLFAELHIHGIYSVPQLRLTLPSTRRSKTFQGWDIVPPLVCVVLIVPRSALEVLDSGHTIFQCETFSDTNIFHNTHSSIRPIFGELVVLPDGRGTIREDPRGINGDSSLIVSFYVASWILAQYPNVMVGFGIKSTPANTGVFMKKLGPFLRIFAKSLTDRDHVFLCRERPDNDGEFEHVAPSGSSGTRLQRDLPIAKLSFNGGVGWFCKRVDITEDLAKDRLANKAPVSNKQISPNCIQVSFGGHHYPFHFPIPVDGSQSKMRIARKSSYVEIEIPFRLSPLKQVDLQPFPIMLGGPNATSRFICWNAPYVNLSRLSMVTTKDSDWVPSHMVFTFSNAERERRLQSVSMANKSPSANFRATIHSMLSDFSKGKVRIVSLREATTSHILVCIFLNSVRIDLSSGTVIGDVVVIVPERPILRLLANAVNGENVSEITCFGEEARWWRYALPVFAERCRTWKHDASTCKYVLSSSYPLSLENLLCSCGKGKNLGPFMNIPKWKALGPYATRVAISTIFPVTYLEDVTFDMGMVSDVTNATVPPSPTRAEVCYRCEGPGKPKLLQCSGCKVTKYCSGECQKEDWKVHKMLCKNMKNILQGTRE